MCRHQIPAGLLDGMQSYCPTSCIAILPHGLDRTRSMMSLDLSRWTIGLLG